MDPSFSLKHAGPEIAIVSLPDSNQVSQATTSNPLIQQQGVQQQPQQASQDQRDPKRRKVDDEEYQGLPKYKHDNVELKNFLSQSAKRPQFGRRTGSNLPPIMIPLDDDDDDDDSDGNDNKNDDDNISDFFFSSSENQDEAVPLPSTSASSRLNLSTNKQTTDSFSQDDKQDRRNCEIDAYDDSAFEKFSPYDEDLETMTYRQMSANEAIYYDYMPTNWKIYWDQQKLPKKIISQQALNGITQLVGKNDLKRPYMTMRARKFLKMMGPWDGFKAFAGELLHVDLSPWEIAHLASVTQDVNNYKLKNESSEVTTALLLSGLPGRTSADLKRILEDPWWQQQQQQQQRQEEGQRFQSNAELSSIEILQKISNQVSNSKPMQSIPYLLDRELSAKFRYRGGWSMVNSALTERMIKHFKPKFACANGSSDVRDFDFSPDSRFFAAGAVSPLDVYNRSGNFRLGYLPKGEIMQLSSHRMKNGSSANNESMYATITGVKFSLVNNVLFSAGYDCTLRSWRLNDGMLIETKRFSDKLTTLTSSIVAGKEILVTGDEKGIFYACRADGFGRFSKHLKIPKPADLTLNAVAIKAVFVPGSGSRVVVGYSSADNEEQGHTGVVDLKSNSSVTLHDKQMSVTDIYAHQRLPYFAASYIAPQSGRKKNDFKSFGRLYKLDQPDAILEVGSSQKDINIITMSSDMRLMTLSGTDSTTKVYDLRFASRELFNLPHGDSRSIDLRYENGVQFAIWPDDQLCNQLITGSSDSCVKLWDVRTGTFEADLLTSSSPIVGGQLSPDGQFLVVGDTMGAVTVLMKGWNQGLQDMKLKQEYIGNIEDQTERNTKIDAWQGDDVLEQQLLALGAANRS
ncbi:WD40-repeat-containing domain protein [Lipomyces japonicus]|uniref:WD40-repeat-containing domain protein n=1 Tax=Lipomyces japonicus TaxID=56871 RepID=UPI0034CD0EC1